MHGPLTRKRDLPSVSAFASQAVPTMITPRPENGPQPEEKNCAGTAERRGIVPCLGLSFALRVSPQKRTREALVIFRANPIKPCSR